MTTFEQSLTMGAPLYTNEDTGPIELIPNPDFVFPARPDTSGPSSSYRHPVTRRPRSHQNLSSSLNAPAPRASASISALPSFSFNPAAESQISPLSTPPHSPSLNTPSTPSRGTRHRRGGSEFIGVDHKSGNVSVVNNSPGKPDFTAQPPLHLGPPQGRRHAHRRSGAISCHDLASILQPKDVNTQLRSGSAPTSPFELENTAKSFFAVGQRRSSDHSLQGVSIEESSESDTLPQPRPQSRARVGFADRVEYIRPLSTISSETESSMSTIRGHSVTGSCSSVISAGATSPSPARMARPSLNTTFEDEPIQPRPHTSQSLFGSPIDGRRPTPFLRQCSDERPKSEAGLPTSILVAEGQTKRRSFGWWDAMSKQSTSPRLLATTSSTSELSSSPPSSPHSARRSLESDQETVTNVHLSMDSRKPRKVRSWAHSFISRKHKPKKGTRRPSTPPARSHSSDTDESDSTDSQPEIESQNFEFNFDTDNTVTIINESVQSVTPRQDVFPPRPTSHSPDPDIQSPVIDLDAALGPLSSCVDGRSGSKQQRSRRSMHSASLTSGAFALGAQHRRTESAPELMPFELRNAKFTQQSVMPDVFEEEDEELAAEESDKETKPTTHPLAKEIKEDQQEESIGVHVVEVDETAVAAGPWPIVSGFGSNRRKKSEGLSIDTGSRPTSMVYDPPEKLHLPLAHQPSVSVEVVEDHEEVRDSKSSDDTITPPPTADKSPPSDAQFRYALPLPPQHIMTPDTMSDASLYSPFFSPSQASLDTPRLDTTPSSITDSRSFSFGEPGPEVRMSSDDVPSLTSSRSTMTSPAIYPMLPPASAGRTSSVYSMHSTATAELARHKRGSIASLSRLVAGSFGERSKLSIESRPMSQHLPVEPKKVKSRHRLSKLVQFWKSKDDRPASRA